MSIAHITVAADLLGEVENRYKLTLDVAELAKRLLDEARERRRNDPFALGFEVHEDVSGFVDES
jgi:hypothetical protein